MSWQNEKWALISVFDKTGIADYARELVGLGWNILASGGTAKLLRANGIAVRDTADLAGGGAILKHRVVTLSREIAAALLADKNDPEQMKELESLKIPVIDMVVCDFYPLEAAIAKQGATILSVVEDTDIGGPTMVSEAAKGFRIVVCRFADRQMVLWALKEYGDVPGELRQKLRARAEYEVARYRLTSARFHSRGSFDGMLGELMAELPKGENGYQIPAGLYADNPSVFGLHQMKVIDGAPLSYCNLTDIDRLRHTMVYATAGWRQNFGVEPSVAIGVKHGNPCGAAVGSLQDEDSRAYAAISAATGDSRAIFGGLLMTNFPIDGDLASKIVHCRTDGWSDDPQRFDSVIAPGFDDGAIAVFQRKRGRCRIVQSPAISNELPGYRRIRQTWGGFLAQPNYRFFPSFYPPKILVCGCDSKARQQDVVLASAVGRMSNSNTITIIKDRMLIGNGVGQQDRVGAAELAIKRARDAGHGKQLEGSAAYSDSFFPFPDGPKVLIDAGVKTIFTSSGSVNDNAVIDLCQKSGITLYMMPDNEARGFCWH